MTSDCDNFADEENISPGTEDIYVENVSQTTSPSGYTQVSLSRKIAKTSDIKERRMFHFSDLKNVTIINIGSKEVIAVSRAGHFRFFFCFGTSSDSVNFKLIFVI